MFVNTVKRQGYVGETFAHSLNCYQSNKEKKNRNIFSRDLGSGHLNKMPFTEAFKIPL